MIRAYTFALDPTPAQERALRSHCGAARFAYNHMLGVIVAVMDQREAERTYGVADPNLTPRMGWSAYSLRKEWNARKDEVAPWWADVSKEAFASGCSALASALDAWLKSRTGKRSGGRVGWPRFKSRRSAMSCTFTTGTIRLRSLGPGQANASTYLRAVSTFSCDIASAVSRPNGRPPRGLGTGRGQVAQ